MTALLDRSVGEIVAADSRTAGVFDKFGIDFCCGGRRSLAEACRAAAADQSLVVQALDALPPPETDAEDVARWPLDRVIDHIVSTHHAYVRAALPTIAGYLAKLEQVHGAAHPELKAIEDVFARLSHELEMHMLKEEQILFPYVDDLVEWDAKGSSVLTSPFGSVSNPIRVMEHEHDDAAVALREIRALTNGYTPPPDGCVTYDVCMKELARFERNLHRHVHLENNVLFPRAIELENGV
jgi:regulator of cell morphogenesis and NO signaling